MKPKLSEAQEDYLKHIFLLSEHNDELVSALLLAEHLQVKPASVTNMLKKLAELNLIDYKPYYGARLTRAGELVALEVLRHHRLLELYLSEILGFGWEEVHEEAERLEHVISERLEARIAEKLGHPTHDPHGDPIPTVDLQLPESPARFSLTSLKPEQQGSVARVRTQDSGTLNMLSRLNLTLGAQLRVLSVERDGIRIETDGDTFLLPADLASKILIELNN
ncbi:MAG: metal-dependent transcriptional regulator [Candidatus Cyclonatronum sp.]|uniref:metal-dependent transcriptional regulator n=1 Tax=Cyclonatronum sp. TaxID=3024185 RepID=UPI0025C29D03|nr:metal-dependent transcriptional regulator [Cyclonatronum sp.]MCC5933527.1 metal-dependent transcriptional regulator [Balneolales bacterium]MCH8486525.1 metal-dependent transcriptional regulator [Cyclonatronum sp.]